MPASDMLNHAVNHIFEFLGGDRKEDHLAHAAWNILGAIHSLELWPDMNKNMLRGENCSVPESAKKVGVPVLNPQTTTGGFPSFMEKKNG